jgi:hypothetical protein
VRLQRGVRCRRARLGRRRQRRVAAREPRPQRCLGVVERAQRGAR